MNAFERQRHYKEVFKIVIESYLEIRETSRSNSCEELYSRFLECLNGTAGSGGQQRVGRVTATALDFVADVELAVKKVTTTDEYHNFILDVPLSDELEAKIGRELDRRNIDKLKLYFKPKDVA